MLICKGQTTKERINAGKHGNDDQAVQVVTIFIIIIYSFFYFFYSIHFDYIIITLDYYSIQSLSSIKATITNTTDGIPVVYPTDVATLHGRSIFFWKRSPSLLNLQAFAHETSIDMV